MLKYAAKEDGETYNKLFGGIGAFKKSRLKQARRKRMQDPKEKTPKAGKHFKRS